MFRWYDDFVVNLWYVEIEDVVECVLLFGVYGWCFEVVLKWVWFILCVLVVGKFWFGVFDCVWLYVGKWVNNSDFIGLFIYDEVVFVFFFFVYCGY